MYDDKGMLVAEKDATGEQETRYEYEPGSATVRTEKYPGGGMRFPTAGLPTAL